MKSSIASLPGGPAVRWIRPLNRRLQMLFGWGDAAAEPGSTRGTEDLALPEPCSNRPAYAWRQHPTAPLPFFVRDYARWPDDEKLAWIRQELGNNADLPDFARCYEPFADAKKGAAQQKAACLKLFGEHSGSTWRKECDLPPEELTGFQRAWEPDAPERCCECGKATLPPGRFSLRRSGRPFCSEACACAGKRLTCRGCGGAVDAEHPRCSSCAWGLAPAPARAKRSALDAMLEDSELALAKFLRVTRAVECRDYVHEPAWKRRRRA
jgi:hypothetical protein